MNGGKTRLTSGVVALLLICNIAHGEPAAETRHSLNIPAEPMGEALNDLAAQTGLQIVFNVEDTPAANIAAPTVVGQLSAKEALKLLLDHTKLRYQLVNDHTILIASTDGVPLSSADGPASSPARIDESSRARFHLAQANSNGAQSDSSVERGNAEQTLQKEPVRLEEVIVTAEKRRERLQDVPVPVTSINANTLVDSNQVRIQDFYSSVPGFTISPSPSAGGEQMLAIRGISTGFGTNPTVGITVDEVPYGSSTNLGGNVVPDIDPSDLARVEVLRGPQGTLYGASSMGGLLKFVTIDPSTDALSGRVQAGTVTVHNGAELGYNFRGSVNLPITDTLAVRASGFTRLDPGYIDNPVLGVTGVNEDRVSGGRLSALWRPSDALSLKLSALYQDTRGNGSNDVDIGAGLAGLQQDYKRGIGGYDRQVQAYSATLQAKVAGIDIVSATGFNVNQFSDSLDYSFALGAAAQAFGVTGAPLFTQGRTNKFTQEIRLSASINPTVEWLLGGFYTHESSPYAQNVMAENTLTGALVGSILDVQGPSTYAEYAGFADLTFHITDEFDIQIGGRESHIRQTFSEPEVLFGTPIPSPTAESTANAFTYLVTPRVRLSPDLMVYARLASGYRAGGPNLNPDPATPRQYDPDKTQNYELGVKADVLDHRVTLDTSLYYIDWKHLQLNLLDSQNQETYTTNGSGAKSQGVELSIQSHPIAGLRLDAWVTFGEAVLTENIQANSGAYGIDGDRLPYGARFSGNLSFDEEFPITGRLSGSVGATESYVGSRIGTFTATADRQYYPAYSRTDLRAGLQLDSWTGNLFVTNLADRRGVLGGGLGNFPPYAFAYIQPRAIGLSLTKTF